MSIANVGMTNALVNLATGMQTSKVQSEIGVAVLKSIQDQQKAQAEALLSMMRQMSGLNGSGQIVNVSSTAGSRGFAGGTAYVASKFALGGMTECWRAELRKHDIRVMQVNPSEVLTNFSTAAGGSQKPSERKLRSEEIAHAIASMLSMDDRGFTTELTVFATNPD